MCILLNEILKLNSKKGRNISNLSIIMECDTHAFMLLMGDIGVNCCIGYNVTTLYWYQLLYLCDM